jgi:hypothetical protein
VSPFLEVIFGAVSHILNLFLLFAYCCKVIKSYFKQPLIAEFLELFNGLSLINLLLESDSPLGKRDLEDSHTFFLKKTHHFGIKLCLIMSSVLVNCKSLKSLRTNLGFIERISVLIFPLLQSVHYKAFQYFDRNSIPPKV